MKITLFKKKTCAVPTLYGWALVGIVCVVVSYGAVVGINPFLSLNKPVDAKVMVVEGWLPDYALKEAFDEFNRNRYALLIATGIPIEKGNFLSSHQTYARVASETLKRLGMDSSKIAVVPSQEVKADRTFASACAVRDWIQRSGMAISGFNVVSLGPHSRRTLLLYRKAFRAEHADARERSISIGIESYRDSTYDPAMWWKTSNGFRAVIDECIAYLYARFIFRGEYREGGSGCSL